MLQQKKTASVRVVADASTPNEGTLTFMRKIITSVAVLLFIVIWAIVFARLGSSLPMPKWAEMIFYITAGIGWAFLLKPLFSWMNRGEPPVEDD